MLAMMSVLKIFAMVVLLTMFFVIVVLTDFCCDCSGGCVVFAVIVVLCLH